MTSVGLFVIFLLLLHIDNLLWHGFDRVIKELKRIGGAE